MPLLFFPGMNLLMANEMGDSPDFHFFARSGRVLVEPVFAGGFQRNDGSTTAISGRWRAGP